MPRQKRTRVPSADGGPENLKDTRANQKDATLRSATAILEKLTELQLPFTESGWDEAKAMVDPAGASWRATYRPHVKHLFAALRDPATKGGLTAIQADQLRARLAKALQCVAERDAEIDALKKRIGELQDENVKMGRGTRARRGRRPRQSRQAPADDGGSD